MLNYPVFIVRHVDMLLALICEKKAVIDPDAWEKSCNDHMNTYYYNSPWGWNQHNPTVSAVIKTIF